MPLIDAYTRLDGRLKGRLRPREPLSRHTSFRIGGPAGLFVECDTVGDLSLVTQTLAEEGVSWTVLGRGTNVLASDEGYDGAIIVLGRDFRRHAVDGTHIRSGCGVSLAALVQAAFGKGMTGFEFAVGIPGTVGGALLMNAGSRDKWIGGIVDSVTVFVPGVGLRRLGGSEIGWAYRRSGLSGQGIAVEASLVLDFGDEWTIRQTMEASLSRRKRSQPLSLPSAGSVFVNPEGASAGALIEGCGLKGSRVGGAQISEVHANFIVNTGNATASDVVRLIQSAQRRVREVHGIELRPEIRFLGSFDAA